MLRVTLKSHSTICIFNRNHKKMWVSYVNGTPTHSKRDTKNVTNWPPYLWNHPNTCLLCQTMALLQHLTLQHNVLSVYLLAFIDKELRTTRLDFEMILLEINRLKPIISGNQGLFRKLLSIVAAKCEG